MTIHSRRSSFAVLALLLVVGALLATMLTRTTPTHAAASAQVGSAPISAAYIEVNSNDFANVARYSLASTGAPVFGIGIIFAANINYDGTRAQLFFNPQVQALLNNQAGEIAPLHARGIKVYLAILGNHQGAGISNFPDQASAAAFAQQLANAETQYNLDGIDFDDEYAEYGRNGTGEPNHWSFPYLVQALRADAPTKGISLYFYGPVVRSLSYGNINVGTLLNYSWNTIYGDWNVPQISSMTDAQLSPAAINIQGTDSLTAATLATRTVKEGYGAYLTYNLPNGDDSAYVSAFTQSLYGSAAVYK